MKKISLVASFLFYSTTALFAQDTARVLSKFEKFYSQKGHMIKIESNKLGAVGDIDISLQRVSSMETGEYRLALVLTQIKTALFSVVGSGALFIDYDELDGVQKALNFYLQEVKTKKPKNDPSYYFTTLNNVVVSCSYITTGFGSGWYISLSQRYEHLKTTIAGTLITVKNKDIDDLVEVINKSKSATNF